MFSYTVTLSGSSPVEIGGSEASFLVYNPGIGQFAVQILVGDSLSFFQFFDNGVKKPAPGVFRAINGKNIAFRHMSTKSDHRGLTQSGLASDRSTVTIVTVSGSMLSASFHLEFRGNTGAIAGTIIGDVRAAPNRCQQRLAPDGRNLNCLSQR